MGNRMRVRARARIYFTDSRLKIGHGHGHALGHDILYLSLFITHLISQVAKIQSESHREKKLVAWIQKEMLSFHFMRRWRNWYTHYLEVVARVSS